MIQKSWNFKRHLKLTYLTNVSIVDVLEIKDNKMELLQSQAPVDRELLGSSASARYGTFDIGHQMSDMGHGTQIFGNIEEKLFPEGTK